MGESNELDDCSVSCSLEYFVDYEAVTRLIDNAKNCYTNPNSIEEALEALKRIESKYVEQPHLIDPYLDRILGQILAIIKCKDDPYDLKQCVAAYLFIIINARGHKHIVRYLPHEVGDLDIVLKLLEDADKHESTRWEMLYFLLLWLSIIVMIPFDMSRLESNVTEIGDKKTIPERILDICKKFILSTHTTQEVASYLCARFVSRVDMKRMYLASVIDWLCDGVVKESKSLSWQKFGPMSTLALILKHGKREDLQPFAQKIYDCIIEANCLQNKFRLTRKYGIKIIQRVGLTCLRVRIAEWRYNRGCRSLVAILHSKATENTSADDYNAVINENAQFETDNDDVPQLVEEVMAHLLEALRDTDIVVRWPAAKGIGRITDRLTSEFGDDVVDNVLTLFSPRETSCAWNGGCLTLAELGRRGLLLPNRLPQVVDVLIRALVYEAPLRSVTAGTVVRDAACYTTWALARAYDPDILKPYVAKIASSLLIVVAFDREVSCRRAASATFQEHVGRQGTFPHGIEIVSISDYFSVGGTSNAFLNIGVSIARYPEYTRTMIDHLFSSKIRHWDADIRDLASKALYKLTALDPAYMITTLEKIIPLTEAVDLQTRHGALLSVGEIIHALAEISDPDIKLSCDVIEQVWTIIPRYCQRGQFRGVGGDVNKEASCFVIMKCSMGKLPVVPHVIECWQRLINECLPYESSKVRLAATDALAALSEQYYVSDEEKRNSFMQQLDVYFKQAASNTECSRLGYALALGSLSPALLDGHLDTVMNHLIENTAITRENMAWASLRKQAVTSLVSIWKKFCIDSDDYADKCLHYTVPLLRTFLNGMSDYTVDKRGDIGSMVREASMKAIQIIITSDPSKVKDIVTVDLIEQILSALAKQAVERITSIRVIAVTVFVDVLFCSDIPKLSYAEEIKPIFQKRTNVWHNESAVFNMFVQLLKYPAFLQPVLSGIIKTIGGITESLVKSSSSALATYLNACCLQDVEAVCRGVVEEFRNNACNDTIVKPLILFLQKFLAYPCLKPILLDSRNTFAEDIYNLTAKQISRTKDYKKFSFTVDVFCQLIQARGTVSKRCLAKLCVLLHHRFTWLRKMVALNLSEAIMMYSDECDISPETEEEITELLTGHNWHDCSVEEAKAAVDKLRPLLNIPPSTTDVSHQQSTSPASDDVA